MNWQVFFQVLTPLLVLGVAGYLKMFVRSEVAGLREAMRDEFRKDFPSKETTKIIIRDLERRLEAVEEKVKTKAPQ